MHSKRVEANYLRVGSAGLTTGRLDVLAQDGHDAPVVEFDRAVLRVNEFDVLVKEVATQHCVVLDVVDDFKVYRDSSLVEDDFCLVRAEYLRGQHIEGNRSLSGAVENMKRRNAPLEKTAAHHVGVRS